MSRAADEGQVQSSVRLRSTECRAARGVPSLRAADVNPGRAPPALPRRVARCWARSSAGSTATIGRPTAFEIHVTSPWQFWIDAIDDQADPARSSRSPASPTAMQVRCTLAGSGVVTTRMRSASRNAVLPIRASVDSPASGSLPTSSKTRAKRRRSSVSSDVDEDRADPSAWRAVRGERSRTTVARAG